MMDGFNIPVVDLSEWVGGGRGNENDCGRMARALHVSYFIFKNHYTHNSSSSWYSSLSSMNLDSLVINIRTRIMML